MSIISRRSMLHAIALATGSLALPSALAWADDKSALKIGVASYSLRKLDVNAAIAALQQMQVKYVSLKDMHLPLGGTPEQIKAGVEKFTDAGITPLSCGVVTLPNNETAIRKAFEYAKHAAIPTIVCNPDPGCFEILDRMVKQYDIRLAIHNHGPEDKKWPTPNEPYEAAKKHDPRIGLCIDVGHTARAKVDPAEAMLKFQDRLFDVHMKDLVSTDPKAAGTEVGKGKLDIKAMLAALKKINYQHLIGLEYEIKENNPVPGMIESLRYLRETAATL